MDQTDQIDFGDIQKEERFKILKKNLNKNRLKSAPNGKTQPPWSNCSTINGDPSDLNYTSISQFSKFGSEILTSSQNLKNLKRPNYLPMATSSVKKYSETEETIDRDIMPPPSSIATRPFLKRPAPVVPAQERIKFSRQHNNHFSKEKQMDLNSSKEFSDPAGPSELQKEKIVDRHFYRWRVALNDRGELLIKGSVNNETWARSKAVVNIISSTKLQSKYQHTYHLHGSIIDENNELPKYVYMKFYNGFSDDWRNVHEIWKNYVALGSKESFRWPTDVNYSDDDLNSEITDITHVQKTSKKFQELSSMEKSTPQRSSGYSSDLQHEKEVKIQENLENNKNTNNQSARNNCTVNSEQFNDNNDKEDKNLHENRSQFDVSSDRSCSGNLYTALNYAFTLKDIIFEDKLTTITQNLLHEKCPKEYVQCVNRTIEYLNYILSFKISQLDENIKKPMIELKCNSPLDVTERKCSTPLSSTQNLEMEVIPQVVENKKNTKKSSNEINEKLMRQIISEKILERNPNEINERVNEGKHEINEKMIEKKLNSMDNCERNLVIIKKQVKYQEDSDASESEIYAGVPKVSEKILQSKIDQKRHRRNDENGITRARNISREYKNNLPYDSCVSLFEEEIHKNPNDERNLALDFRNIKTKESRLDSNNDEFLNERRVDLHRENRVPLEMLRNDKISTKIPVFSQIPNTASNERRKSMVNKENMEANNQNKFKEIFPHKEMHDDQNEVSEVQQKEKKNLSSNDINNPGHQKPRIINSEKVNFENFKNPNQFLVTESKKREEKREKEERSNNVKTTQFIQNTENKHSENIAKNVNNSFGSEENPKFLKNWNPLVKSDGKNHQLVFEGTLLNAVSQLMKKKFMTNQVIRRISVTSFETADHQFYKLLGEINYKKNVIPKEILAQSRVGCPVDIDNFCATWLKLTGESNDALRSQKPIEDKKYIPVSSRGRSILPPLNFWAGERVVKKDGDAVYKSGEPKKYFITSIIGSPNERRQKSPEQVVTNETVKGVLNSEEGRQVVKKMVPQKLQFGSSDSEEEINIITKQKSQNNVDIKEVPPKNEKERRQYQNHRSSHLYGLRKRQKISYEEKNDSEKIQKGEELKQVKKLRNPVPTIHCTYNRKDHNGNATLSDDQMSVA